MLHPDIRNHIPTLIFGCGEELQLLHCLNSSSPPPSTSPASIAQMLINANASAAF
jgi:hypothetical protein